MKKLALVLSLFMVVPVVAKDLFTTNVEGHTIIFREAGFLVEMVKDGVVVTKRVVIEKNRQALTNLMKAFQKEISAIKPIVVAEATPAIIPSPARNENSASTGAIEAQSSELSGTLEKRSNVTHDKLQSLVQSVKKQFANVMQYVITNVTDYPLPTGVAVLVGGALGFKAGQKIAQWAEFQKRGSYITQTVSTVSGATFATIATWAVLNKFYKA